MAEDMKLIYKAIAGVMEDIGAVSKEKEFRSNQGSYKFRGIDDVMNALHPAMVKNKIFVVPVILEQIREVRTSKTGTSMYVSICKIRYEFYAEDGSCVSAVVIGEGMDTGDKATNKAMSIAFKYACFQVFCIPTEEMIDPDAERPELENCEEEGRTRGGKKNSGQRASSAQKNEKKQSGTENKQSNNSKPVPANIEKVTQEMIEEINQQINKYASKGLKMEKILAMYKISDLAEMTTANFDDCMKKLQLYENGGK